MQLDTVYFLIIRKNKDRLHVCGVKLEGDTLWTGIIFTRTHKDNVLFKSPPMYIEKHRATQAMIDMIEYVVNLPEEEVNKVDTQEIEQLIHRVSEKTSGSGSTNIN